MGVDQQAGESRALLWIPANTVQTRIQPAYQIGQQCHQFCALFGSRLWLRRPYNLVHGTEHIVPFSGRLSHFQPGTRHDLAPLACQKRQQKRQQGLAVGQRVDGLVDHLIGMRECCVQRFVLLFLARNRLNPFVCLLFGRTEESLQLGKQSTKEAQVVFKLFQHPSDHGLDTHIQRVAFTLLGRPAHRGSRQRVNQPARRVLCREEEVAVNHRGFQHGNLQPTNDNFQLHRYRAVGKHVVKYFRQRVHRAAIQFGCAAHLLAVA